MDEDRNQKAAEAFVAGVAEWDAEGLGRLYHPDFTTEWPQSGERVRGLANLRAVMDRPDGAPVLVESRVSGRDDLWVVEGLVRYGEEPYLWVAILEIHDGRISLVREYWGAPFKAPGWREPFVEQMAHDRAGNTSP